MDHSRQILDTFQINAQAAKVSIHFKYLVVRCVKTAATVSVAKVTAPNPSSLRRWGVFYSVRRP